MQILVIFTCFFSLSGDKKTKTCRYFLFFLPPYFGVKEGSGFLAHVPSVGEEGRVKLVFYFYSLLKPLRLNLERKQVNSHHHRTNKQTNNG